MNIQQMMRQAQQMQRKMKKAQDEISAQIFEGTAGGGMVVVSANGAGEVKAVKIEKEVVDPDDVEMLQDLVMAATNQAISRGQEAMAQAMSKFTAGMNIPGLM